jgi:hypothetical protein
VYVHDVDLSKRGEVVDVLSQASHRDGWYLRVGDDPEV